MTRASASLHFAVSPYLSATCAVLVSGDLALIVDPGLQVEEDVERILSRQGASPVALLLSHGHLDHVADAYRIADKYGIEVLVGAGDEYRLDNPLEQLPSAFTTTIRPLWDERGWHKPAHTTPIHHGHTIALGEINVQARSYPGHTEGSTIYVVNAPVHVEPLLGVTPTAIHAPGIAFTGDVLFAGTIGRTDLPGGNPEEMKSSLIALREYALENPDLVIVPGHGPLSTLRDELANNRFLGMFF